MPVHHVQVLVPEEEPEKVDFDEWEGHFDSEWSGDAVVYEGENQPPPEVEKFDEVTWDSGTEPVKTIPKIPSKSAMNRMKKAELEQLAAARGVEVEGTKAEIIEILLTD